MTSHHPNVSTALQDNEAALQEPEETQNDTACCPGPGREKAHEESSR